MKKIILIFIVIITFTACTHKTKNENLITEFYFTYNDVAIKLNTDFTNTLVTIGSYNEQYTNELSEQYNNVYSFDEFEIETIIKDKVEKIFSIYFTSKNIYTNEGIKIGDSVEKMLENYGNNYENSTEELYTYRLNNTAISFIIENNKIINIQYNYL